MYSKQAWVTGDVITEDKLNHMEEGISTGGGIYTYGEVVAFDGEVTTVKEGEFPAYAEITLQGELPKSDISVTFNGQNYTLPYGNLAGFGDYWGEAAGGGPSFTNYPVYITGGGIYTPEAGTYSLKINEIIGKFTVNDGFKENMVVAVLEGTNNEFTLDKTYLEIISALEKGKHIDFMCYHHNEDAYEQFHLFYASDEQVALVRITISDDSPVLTRINFLYTTEDGYPTNHDPLS